MGLSQVPMVELWETDFAKDSSNTDLIGELRILSGP